MRTRIQASSLCDVRAFTRTMEDTLLVLAQKFSGVSDCTRPGVSIESPTYDAAYQSPAGPITALDICGAALAAGHHTLAHKGFYAEDADASVTSGGISDHRWQAAGPRVGLMDGG